MGAKHSELVSDTLKFLNSLPFCKAFAVNPGPYGPRSVSDIIFCYHGLFGAIEIKIGYDKPSKLQAIFIRDVKKAKGTSKACWSLEEAKNVIKNIDNEIKFMS
jgi:hypothetical protein